MNHFLAVALYFMEMSRYAYRKTSIEAITVRWNFRNLTFKQSKSSFCWNFKFSIRFIRYKVAIFTSFEHKKYYRLNCTDLFENTA